MGSHVLLLPPTAHVVPACAVSCSSHVPPTPLPWHCSVEPSLNSPLLMVGVFLCIPGNPSPHVTAAHGHGILTTRQGRHGRHVLTQGACFTPSVVIPALHTPSCAQRMVGLYSGSNWHALHSVHAVPDLSSVSLMIITHGGACCACPRDALVLLLAAMGSAHM